MIAYSQDLRDRAIGLHKSGMSRKSIAKLLSINYGTIKTWVRRYLETGDYSSRQHLNSGVPRKFDDKAAVLSYLKDNPNALALEIRDALVPELPISTFRDSMSRMGITYKKRNGLYSAK